MVKCVLISREEKRKFELVCDKYGLNQQEKKLCRQAYQKNPDSGRITYAALYDALFWRIEMGKGLTLKIKELIQLQKALKEKAEAAAKAEQPTDHQAKANDPGAQQSAEKETNVEA